ncbi:hypothetical protein GCM10012287_56340 [Streptomyces daqingensis]|uniref:Uncharacterized protein n=1 Tax=Streptomyces daqingensis TaxID=1472640 RepID=A0ABQ2MUX7_9ACTN|nr:hypothetical protein [Streptomyces daqingensis]GGO58359.1 hypothetical protein GCM10012287_56340 [Streptomyces daqingensis]
MRAYASAHEAWPIFEFEELANSFEDPAECFPDLFIGFPGEPAKEKEARLAAARDVLAELKELGQHDEVARENAAYAEALDDIVPLWDRTPRKPRMPWTEDAA